MHDTNNNPWWEAGLRRDVTAEELARLRSAQDGAPGLSEEEREDFALNTLLRRMPDAPLASNFTSQVLAAVDRERRQPLGFGRWRGLAWLRLRRWAPRLALASAVVVFAHLSIKQYMFHKRVRFAQSVAEVGEMTTLVTPGLLQDFNAIYRLKQVPVKVDEELFSALITSAASGGGVQ